MPNRGIKESICTSKTLNQLSAEEEVLFYRLIVNCDDYGRMLADSEIILSKCFPRKLSKITVKDIDKWIQSLCQAGLILLYTNDDERYLQFAKWDKHQRIRASDSKYPAPDDEESILLSFDSERQQSTDNSKHMQSNAPETRDTRHENEHGKLTPSKVKYADYVSMTETEYQKLIERFGQAQTDWMVSKLNVWKGANGKTKSRGSDYLKILNWVVKAFDEQGKRASPVMKEALPVL